MKRTKLFVTTALSALMLLGSAGLTACGGGGGGEDGNLVVWTFSSDTQKWPICMRPRRARK